MPLGRGLWSFVEPTVGHLGNWVLSVVTLGIKSIQDDTYASAALGLHELPSLYILLIASTVIFSAPGLIATTPLLRSFLRKAIDDKNETTGEGLAENRRKRVFKLLLTFTLIATLLGSYFLVKFMMVNQQNLIASFFHQRLTIVRPFITDGDLNMYNSLFARIKTKGEYLSLMEKLRAIGTTNGLEVPKVDTW